MELPKLLRRFYREGLSQRAMVTKLTALGIQTSKSTVGRLLKSLGLVPAKNPKSPQQYNRKLTVRSIRTLVRLVRIHKIRQTSRLQKELAKQGTTVSCKTVARALKKVPTMRMKRPRQQQFLTGLHKSKRREWAKQALEEKIDWSKVFFADEKVWFVDGPAWRPKQWCDSRDPPLVVHRKGTRNGAIHVWGAFSLDAVPDLYLLEPNMNAEAYCNVIEQRLLPILSPQHNTLYHDRHPCHVAKQTQKWMADHQVNACLFPPKDADINPIENLWGILTRRIFSGTQTFGSKNELWAAIQVAWAELKEDREVRAALVGSMTERLKQLVRQKGGLIKF